MKYRKKPVVIEAMQWTPQDLEQAGRVGGWMLGNGFQAFKVTFTNELEIETLEGVMTASPGDWIIRGTRGEFYPCKPLQFNDSYEQAED